MRGSPAEFVFNLAGQHTSIWNGSNRNFLEGKYYWGASNVGYYGAGQTWFQHMDWLGSERTITTYNGSVEGSYSSLPFGDVQNDPNTDNGFAMLDYDSETATNHAQFRQYSGTQAHWMSPDPYMGSYDISNPQSMNRYAYALNNPLSMVDPSGLISNCSDETFWVDGEFDSSETICTEDGDGAPSPTSEYCIEYGCNTNSDGGGGGGSSPTAPSNAQEPPPACQAKILNATNNQFGTNYTNSNVTSTFNYSTGAGPGQGTLNLNISGSTAGVSTGYYPVHWYTYIIGYGPTLHVVGGDVLDSPQTLPFGPNQGTFHIDSGYPINPIGAAFHWLLNMTKAGGYPKC